MSEFFFYTFKVLDIRVCLVAPSTIFFEYYGNLQNKKKNAFSMPGKNLGFRQWFASSSLVEYRSYVVRKSNAGR